MIDKEYYIEFNNKSHINTDRYKNNKLLKDKETNESLLATTEIYSIPSSSSDMYHRVTSNEVYRLDIIAAKYYRNPLLWWVIAQANEIYDPFMKIEPGTILRIPTIESLYGNNGILL